MQSVLHPPSRARARRILLYALPAAALLLLLLAGIDREGEPGSPDAVPQPGASPAPFGAAPFPAVRTAASPPPSTAPLASTAVMPDLTLYGASSGRAGGGAVIGAGGGPQRYVSVGQMAVPGWTLTGVSQAEAVLADASGREVRLALPNAAGETAVSPGPPTVAPTPAPAPAASAATLTTELRLALEEAETAAGKSAFIVRQVPPPLARAGVRAGDIIKSADGERFDRGEDIDDLVFLIGSGRSIPLVIERGGQETKLTIPGS